MKSKRLIKREKNWIILANFLTDENSIKTLKSIKNAPLYTDEDIINALNIIQDKLIPEYILN